jgi:hypothetical protein
MVLSVVTAHVATNDSGQVGQPDSILPCFEHIIHIRIMWCSVLEGHPCLQGDGEGQSVAGVEEPKDPDGVEVVAHVIQRGRVGGGVKIDGP